MYVDVQITEEDINSGRPYSFFNSALRLAVAREVAKLGIPSHRVFTARINDRDVIEIRYYDDHKSYRATLPIKKEEVQAGLKFSLDFEEMDVRSYS